jgi:protein-S-isoprenylcysteine O-methyltransferase Ste14
VIYGWCVWDFATFGRGTPARIAAPKRLVVRGLYRFTRNPIYIGVLTVILGWAALFQSQVIFHEERRLTELFGSEYDEYRAKVVRWLLSVPRRPKA